MTAHTDTLLSRRTVFGVSLRARTSVFRLLRLTAVELALLAALAASIMEGHVAMPPREP